MLNSKNRHNRRQPLTLAVQRRILVLATCYPSDERDPSCMFMRGLLHSMSRRDYALTVVAPSNGMFHGRRVVHGIETVRFGYFWPRFLERLAKGPGSMQERMAESFLARFQLIPLLMTFVITALRELYNSDAVYASGLGAGLVGALVHLAFGTPLVVLLRGDDEQMANQGAVWRMLTRWMIRHASMVTATTNELIHFVQELGAPEARCHVLQSGVDTDLFHPRSTVRHGSGEIKLLFVGNLTRRKGLQDLLDALDDPALSKVKLIVVGDGPHASILAETAALLGLNDRVEWKGACLQRDVARIMKASDIFCLPSYMEGRPNAVYEAMATGLPVIVTRTGGIPDMVKDEETALLFEPGDVLGLRACIKTLMDSADLRLNMGLAGYDLFIRSKGNWDTTGQELETLLSRVIEESR